LLHHLCSTLFPYTTLFRSGLTVSFHDTYADAESNTSAYAYIHQNNEPTVETVFVRVQTQKGCFVITLMDLVVEPLPVLVPPTERSEEHTSELQSRENLVCR